MTVTVIQSLAESPPRVLANLVTDSVHVAEKNSVCTCFGSFERIRFVMSPSPPSMSISSASSSTNTRMAPVSSTRKPISDQILPGVPTTICSVIFEPFSYRSSRKIVFTPIPASVRWNLPIFVTSPEICFASSRVGHRQSACGLGSDVTVRSMPSTKHAVLPVPLCDCASRLRPPQIFGSEIA